MSIAGQSREKSQAILRGLYDAGATEVRVYPRKQAVDSLVVVPPQGSKPEDVEKRMGIVGELKKLAKHLGRVPFKDRGEKYFPIEMIKEKPEAESPSAPGPGDKDDGDDDT